MDRTVLARRLASLISIYACISAGSFSATAAPSESPVNSSASLAPPTSSPNVLVWMIDDLGFGQLGSYGGLIETPNLDALANAGLRYTNYHTAPICSASRAAFLTGRNPHSVNMGGHAALALPFPGYNGKVPRAAGTVAENLRGNGYITSAIGKWDHLPSSDVSAAGPHTYWPSGQGFDRFYGFLAAEIDNFHPQLWSDHRPVALPKNTDYHLTTDMADRAIEFIRSRDATAPRRPFMIYWATGAVHAPHHAPASFLKKYRGKFDMGWDKAREEILRRQIALSIVPRGTKLPERPSTMPAWASLSPGEKKMYARQMEAFAAQLTHADAEFGRILDNLRRSGEIDNTLVIVTSDNGASAEGAIGGTYNQHLSYNGKHVSLEENQKYYKSWGDETTFPHYSNGWAVTGNTPYRYYKVTTYEGGTHVPLLVSWPSGISARGELRGQYQFVTDITPTILDITNTKPLDKVNGVEQMPFDGTSIEYSFTRPDKASTRKVQYYEMFGNRAIWSDNWKAVNPHYIDTWEPGIDTPFNNNWELYNLAEDPNEISNLARTRPDKLREMVSLFESEANKYNVLPLHNKIVGWTARSNSGKDEFFDRKGIWSYSGPISRIPIWRAPPIFQQSYVMTASLNLRGGETGPIFALGDKFGGMSLYLREGRPVLMYRDPNFSAWSVAADKALPAGKAALRLMFDKTTAGADVTILADGKIIASGAIGHPIKGMAAQAADSFGIGVDSAAPVSSDYQSEAVFPGEISDVHFDFNR